MAISQGQWYCFASVSIMWFKGLSVVSFLLFFPHFFARSTIIENWDCMRGLLLAFKLVNGFISRNNIDHETKECLNARIFIKGPICKKYLYSLSQNFSHYPANLVNLSNSQKVAILKNFSPFSKLISFFL